MIEIGSGGPSPNTIRPAGGAGESPSEDRPAVAQPALGMLGREAGHEPASADRARAAARGPPHRSPAPRRRRAGGSCTGVRSGPGPADSSRIVPSVGFRNACRPASTIGRISALAADRPARRAPAARRRQPPDERSPGPRTGPRPMRIVQPGSRPSASSQPCAEAADDPGAVDQQEVETRPRSTRRPAAPGLRTIEIDPGAPIVISMPIRKRDSRGRRGTDGSGISATNATSAITSPPPTNDPAISRRAPSRSVSIPAWSIRSSHGQAHDRGAQADHGRRPGLGLDEPAVRGHEQEDPDVREQAGREEDPERPVGTGPATRADRARSFARATPQPVRASTMRLHLADQPLDASRGRRASRSAG